MINPIWMALAAVVLLLLPIHLHNKARRRRTPPGQLLLRLPQRRR